MLFRRLLHLRNPKDKRNDAILTFDDISSHCFQEKKRVLVELSSKDILLIK